VADDAKKVTVAMRVNGRACEARVAPMARLLDVLREELHLTGTKEGCGEGECGACAVMIDGVLVNSCLVPVLQVRGANVTTIEGVASMPSGIASDAVGDATLDAVQRAFLEHGGAQCGICTPGMVLAARALLAQNPDPTEADVRTALAGNICRCTGYMRIFAAVLAACKAEASAR
jgi:carbon-monoxide dehydrogenase small subunit